MRVCSPAKNSRLPAAVAAALRGMGVGGGCVGGWGQTVIASHGGGNPVCAVAKG